jgi:hypothetical protein
MIRARAIALAAAALGAAPQAARAAQPSPPPFVITVQPVSGPVMNYFKLTGRPGATIQAGRIVMLNRRSTPLTLLIDPVDATTATSLGVAYQVRGLQIHPPTTWLSLSTRQLVIPPGASRTLSVAVAVPPGAAPGQYVSGVSIEQAGATTQQSVRSNLSVSSTVRYAIGVELTLPGPLRPQLTFTGAQLVRNPSGLSFVVEAANTGNAVLQNVRGSVAVRRGGPQGPVVAVATIGSGTFVTGSSITYTLTAPREQPVQDTSYQLHAVLTYPGGVARLDRRLVFGATAAQLQHQFGGPAPRPRPGSSWPWWAIALVTVGGCALLAGLLTLVRRRARVTGPR